jgi:hypothetical protein
MQKVQENNKTLTGWLLHNQHQGTQNWVVSQPKSTPEKSMKKIKFKKKCAFVVGEVQR